MVMDREGKLYLTALEQDAIIVRSPDGRCSRLVTDARLSWPDSLAVSESGDLYVTVSQIHRSPRFGGSRHVQDNRRGLYKLALSKPALIANLFHAVQPSR